MAVWYSRNFLRTNSQFVCRLFSELTLSSLLHRHAGDSDRCLHVDGRVLARRDAPAEAAALLLRGLRPEAPEAGGEGSSSTGRLFGGGASPPPHPCPLLRPFSCCFGMAAETISEAVRQMAPLVGFFVGPLVVTSGRHHPLITVAGTVLSLVLGRMTFNLGKVPTSFDISREEHALRTLVTTSTANRAVRLVLGATYAYAAISFTIRSFTASVKPSSKQQRSHSSNVSAAATALHCVWRCAGCWALCYIVRT
jgi:hypothetical protein